MDEDGIEDDEVDRWVDKLAGRLPPNASAQETAEVRRLQIAVRSALAEEGMSARDENATPAANDLDETRAWRRLRDRLYEEGLLPAKKASSRIWRRGFGVAATLVLAVAVTWFLRHDPDGDVMVVTQSPPKYRGEATIIQVSDVAPLKRAKHLAHELAQQQAKPQVYFAAGQATVEFEVSAANLDAVRNLLTAQSVATANLAIGVVQVIFLPR
jgi:hypothetical protein